uniref:Uncharacterized protein n=1 Tax=Vespula pensylvanica TaxID=30213 RepID=A0A834N0P1_VESPE|nr:hypothetical protein H0235_017116 [Vespula pensylvanica]
MARGRESTSTGLLREKKKNPLIEVINQAGRVQVLLRPIILYVTSHLAKLRARGVLWHTNTKSFPSPLVLALRAFSVVCEKVVYLRVVYRTEKVLKRRERSLVLLREDSSAVKGYYAGGCVATTPTLMPTPTPTPTPRILKPRYAVLRFRDNFRERHSL